jgi:hypothetical protein
VFNPFGLFCADRAVSYQKYTYWIKREEFFSLLDALQEKRTRVVEAKKAVCHILSKQLQVGFVAPEAWANYEVCKRQMSWYEVSKFVGYTLLVSSFDLAEYGLLPETIIRQSLFSPPILPDYETKKRMTRLEGYQRAKPGEWENIGSNELELSRKWLPMLGMRKKSFQEIFVSHCANHANFIAPQYFITDEKGIVPYSIDKTSGICSSCMEFYNIIGSDFHRKLVVPCPGSVLFAGLPVNKYFEVVSTKSS